VDLTFLPNDDDDVVFVREEHAGVTKKRRTLKAVLG
jgi:hypothetical protein